MDEGRHNHFAIETSDKTLIVRNQERIQNKQKMILAFENMIESAQVNSMNERKTNALD